MRKLFVLLVAIAFFATPALALVESASGPQNVTSCWVKGTATLPYGAIVSLVTGASATFPGRDVTPSDVDLAYTHIYGVHIGPTVTANSTDMTNGTWVNIQTHGYVSQVNLSAGTVGIALNARAGQVIQASEVTGEGSVGSVAFANATTGNVATFGVPDSGGGTTSAWLYGI